MQQRKCVPCRLAGNPTVDKYKVSQLVTWSLPVQTTPIEFISNKPTTNNTKITREIEAKLLVVHGCFRHKQISPSWTCMCRFTRQKPVIFSRSCQGRICITEIRLRSESGIEHIRKTAWQGINRSSSPSNLVFWSSIPLIGSASASVFILVSLSECCETLLLCDRIDICTNEERDDVEEWNPCMLGKELLREGEGQWRRDPADLHDRHETSFPGRVNLVDVPSTGDDGH
jgi:hypothetical protein